MNKRNQELLSKAKKLAARGYTTKVSEDTLSTGETVYLAEYLELSGCMTQGYTREEALSELKQVVVDFIYYLLEDGLEVPSPLSTRTVTAGSNSKAIITAFSESSPMHFTDNKDTSDLNQVSSDTESEVTPTFAVIEGKLV
ncbi:MAG: hypothetical protein GC179_20685 [Anaerolineaceae bacterium]|nr:hypothetical protein [Anaerolineaceae bacterium]